MMPQVRAHAYLIHAQVKARKKEHDQANMLCKNALCYASTNEDVILCQVFNVISINHYLRQAYQIALEYARYANRIAENLGDIGLFVNSLTNIANALGSLGYEEEKEKELLRAHTLSVEKGHPVHAANISVILSLHYMNCREYDKAIKELDAAETDIAKMKFDRLLPSIYSIKAKLYFEMGKYDETNEFLDKASEYTLRYNQAIVEAEVLRTRARVLTKTDPERAEEVFRKSIEYFQMSDSEGIPAGLEFLYIDYGEFMLDRKEKKGLKLLRRAKDILLKRAPSRPVRNALDHLAELARKFPINDITVMDEKLSKTEWERDSLSKVLEISKKIITQSDVMTVLNMIVDSAMVISGAERGFIVIRDGKHYRFEAVKNFIGAPDDEKEWPDIRERVDSAIDLKLLHREGDFLSGQEAKAKVGEPPSNLRALAAIPFLKGDDAIGLLYLDSRYAPIDFGTGMGFLNTFIELAKFTVERLLEYESLGKVVEEKSRELESAKSQLEIKQIELEERFGFENIIGNSQSVKELFKLLNKVKMSDLPVSVYGESGAGKELIAKAIHYSGKRKDRPFVAINCASIPESLLETELFGHEKGAFTGATSTKAGLFELADGGTLFLDEISDMSKSMQQKILRVVEESEVRKIGAESHRKIDIRIITASNRDLGELVEEGMFREDLYYRLNVLSVHIPPLRKRKDDIPLFFDYFINKVASETDKKIKISPEVKMEIIEIFSKYDWPGNVRELENEVYKIYSLAEKKLDVKYVSPKILDPENHSSLPGGSIPDISGGNLKEMVDDFEKAAIIQALNQSNGSKTRAAEILGIPRTSLYKKIERLNISTRFVLE